MSTATCVLCSSWVVPASNTVLACSHVLHQMCFDSHVVLSESEGLAVVCPGCGVEVSVVPGVDEGEVSLGEDNTWSLDSEQPTTSDEDFIASEDDANGNGGSSSPEYDFEADSDEDLNGNPGICLCQAIVPSSGSDESEWLPDSEDEDEDEDNLI